jgi:aminoglycoside N3'-acetyltransferase
MLTSERAVFQSTLDRLIEGMGAGPLLVHSDLLRAGRLLSAPKKRADWLAAHVEVLKTVAANRDLWMPAFNYGFTRSGRFDVRRDPSEVGALTEYFRAEAAGWRTPIPVFSFAGIGSRSSVGLDREVDPFGPKSAFADLVRRDGVILFYGAPFSAATMIHHAERGTGPLYRYDKWFEGVIVDGETEMNRTTLCYHVHPLNRWLEYDWPRLLSDSVNEGICRLRESDGARFIAASARGLVRFWADRLGRDPFYFLDERSRRWVEPMLARLGRRFEIDDFEGRLGAEAS